VTRRQAAGAGALVLALVLAALNLRPALTSVAPVMERIVADLDLSRATAGLVTTIPVLLMGLLAPLAPPLAARWTQERVLAGALALVAGALALRACSDHGALWLLLSAFGAGMGIAVAGPLMSSFIKQHFSRRVGGVIAAYSVSMTGGAALAVVLTLPLSEALGGSWSWALAAWSLPALLALLFWWWVVPTTGPAAKGTARAERLPLRSARAWLLTVFFAAQSGVFYALSTWLVARYEQVGVPPLQASAYASLFMGFGIAGALLVPLLAGRVSDRRWLLVLVTGTTTLAILLIAWRPEWLPWLVSATLGTSTAGTFALALALPVLETESPQQAASLTAMMLCAGYLLGGGVPSLVGIGRDISADYAWPFTFLAALSGLMVAISLLLPSPPPRRGVLGG